MTRDWISLDQIQPGDRGNVGSKVANLAVLRRAGFPVPPGIGLKVSAFQQALVPFRIEIERCLAAFNLSQTGQAQQASACLRPILDQISLLERCKPGLRRVLRKLAPQGEALAVRSSALAEDTAITSFAGQYQTITGVRGLAELEAAITAVWRSAFSPAALASQAGFGILANGMAVLVQPLLAADCAGVAFSKDPTGARNNCLVINAVWGLGQGAVDGSVPADTYWLRRSDLGTAEVRIVEKTAAWQPGPEGSLERQSVPAEQQRAACLPASWLRQVGQFCIAAETFFGAPQDIEWAIAAGQLWLLQSRPITPLTSGGASQSAFPLQNQPRDVPKRFWTLSIPEGRSDAPALRPLELDYIRELESTRLETCLWMGAEHHNQVMQAYGGRVYFSPEPLPLSPADIRIRRKAQQDLTERLARQEQTSWDYWGPEIEQANQRLVEFPGASSGSQQADQLAAALAARKRHHMLHPMISFKLPAAYFRVFEQVTGMSGPQAETAAYRYVAGEESPFTSLMDGLYQLAASARELPRVAALLDHPVPGILEALRTLPEASEFTHQLKAFLQEFGDRTGNGYGSEAGITTPTWLEQPEQMLRLAAIYLDSQMESPAALRQRARRAADAEIETLCRTCPDPQAVTELDRQLRYARRVAAVVELHNHTIEQVGLGQLRRQLLASLDWLRDTRAIDSPEDGFFLTFAEILSALRAAAPVSLRETIAACRKEYEAWQQFEPPACLGIPPAELPARPPFQNDLSAPRPETAGRLQGLGASPGLAQGKARVVRDLVPMPLVQRGEILVAENIGPLWSPIFPLLGGLVLDSGALGQHAATIAREYGIPAVIATGRATQMIHSGDWLEIDGTLGLVKQIR